MKLILFTIQFLAFYFLKCFEFNKNFLMVNKKSHIESMLYKFKMEILTYKKINNELKNFKLGMRNDYFLQRHNKSQIYDNRIDDDLQFSLGR